MSAPETVSVIFAPDLLSASLFDPQARRVVEQWRDGALKVVTDRRLLMLQLKTLRDIGLTPKLIRRWTLWLTSPSRASYLSELTVEPTAMVDHCESLATASHVTRIVCWRSPNRLSGLWLSASDFARGEHR